MPPTHRPLPTPRGLLLDFGGVIIETVNRPQGRVEVVTHLDGLLGHAGQRVPREQLQASLDAGLCALKHWKHASSRRRRPREMGHREIVADFLAADLPEPARAVLIGQASEILEVMGSRISDHHLRPGIPELLDEATCRGIPVGIVSNAHSGRHHRRILQQFDLAQRFAVQVYSDEVGMRKPHPGMIELAAAAIGVSPAECWYVGDTQDRDVVAGRRAGVRAVLLTRTRHTDHPPFAVADQADGTFDTPEGVLAALRDSTPAAPGPPSIPPATRPDRPKAALLLDHGGVVSTSSAAPGAAAALGEHLAGLLATGGLQVGTGEATRLVRDGVASYRAAKHQLDDAESVPQPAPEVFWVEHVGAGMPARVHAVLRAHAHDLMHRWYAVKAQHALRPGIRELLEFCRSRGIPVVMVSNTVSGRGVRDRLAGHGLADLVSGYAFSDEVGHRKPDRTLVDAALAMVDVPPASCWFLGDQARTDGLAAQRAAIGRRVLTRGGKGTDDQLERAVNSGLVTDLIDSPADLIPLLTAALDLPTTPEQPTPETQRIA